MDQKDMSGVLFKADKEGNDKRPDYTGTVTINGKPLRIAAWIKQGKSGKFMSLSFSEERPKEREPQQQARPQPDLGDELSDSIPF